MSSRPELSTNLARSDQWSVYTPDAEAMTWNNLGATHTALGAWDAAHEAFGQALERDPRYPLPQAHLARLAVVRDDRAAASNHLEQAVALGYRATTVDELVHSLHAGLTTQVEGRGD